MAEHTSSSSINTAENNQADLKKMGIIVAAAIILGGSILYAAQQAGQNRQGTGPVQVAQTPPTVAPVANKQQSLIYGVWEQNQTIVYAANAEGTQRAEIAKLPLNIKNIHTIGGADFVYIDNVDQQDHGTRIVRYNSQSGTSQVIANAPDGWGIDTMVVSPDNQWISYWAVKFASGNTVLLGGESRVYTVSMASAATPTLIYDEQVTLGTVVQYPIFWDHSGNLYTDGFSANNQGWNRGLTRSDARGNNKQTILAPDTYSTDPRLSPTSNVIVYTSYDQATGTPLQAQGTTGIAGVAHMNPNTVKTLDLNTLTERTLLSEQGRLYYDPTWKDDSSQLFVRSYGADGTQLTDPIPVRLYAIDGRAEQLDGSTMIDGMILSFSNDGVVTGAPSNSGATGNLGSTYAPIFSGFAINHEGTTVTTIPASNAQYIGQTTQSLPDTIVFEQVSKGTNTLQLASFVVKPNIETRVAQQNDIPADIPMEDGRPQCKPLYKSIVGGLNTTTTTGPTGSIDPGLINITVTTGEDPTLQLGQFGPRTEANLVISDTVPSYKELKPLLKEQYKCFDSPLYLYSARPMPVQVHVTNADILTSNPKYNPTTGWNLYAQPSGSKVDYSYAAPFTEPGTGYTVARDELDAFLSIYAQKAGLSGKEVTDYINFWSNGLPKAAYYVVSHFENPSEIMNFNISPKPSTMIQVIMYFKPITAKEVADYATLPAPHFPEVPERTDFTAVDWSGIIHE